MKFLIIPSIIAKNQKQLDSRLNKIIKYSSLIHLDIMDGKFVNNKSLFFKFKLPKSKKFEAHLMIKNPKDWIKKYSSKVDTIILHYESTNHLFEIIKMVKKKRKKISIALNPKTSIKDIKKCLTKINQLTIMTVYPGSYGARFIQKTLEKIKALRKLKPNLNIEVDGSVNPETIKKLKNAGANLFVSGSYLQESKNIKQAIYNLKKYI